MRASTDYTDVASDMEISKAVYFLKKKDPKKAKETLEAIQKKDKKVARSPESDLDCLICAQS